MAGSSLTAELKRPSALTASEREAWAVFTTANPALASPYFRLAFAECCEAVRSDTRVIVARKGGEIAGFLPVQTGLVGYARPLAGPLGDVHGVISSGDDDVDIPAWLNAAGVPLFEYHSALALQDGWQAGEAWRDGSWIIDLSDGYDAFEAARSAVEPKAFRNIRARRRRLEKDFGDVEFRMDDRRPHILETLFAWKSAQYRRTNVFDVFSVRWARDLMTEISRRDEPAFRGVVSSLTIDGELAAVHAGMASETRCHYWFPAYDPAFNKVSPGLLLLLETARDAASKGQTSVELGPGDFDFKRNLGGYQIPLSAGCVVTRSPAAALRHAARALADTAERAPLGPMKTLPRRILRRADKLSAFYAV